MPQDSETRDRVQPRPVPAEGSIIVQPGDEFRGVDPASLLPRMRLDPSLAVVDALQTSLTIYVDDEEINLDGDELFGSDDGRRLFVADDDDAFGYVVELCGDWIHEWAAESVDRYTFWDRSISLLTAAESAVNDSELADLIWADTSTQTWYLHDTGDE